jgi:hypothetical protein
MIICPACSHIVPEELERCPFCSEEIVAGEPLEADETIEWAIVRTLSTEIEAHIIAGRLRAFGVPAFVLSQVDSTRRLTVGALAIVKVFVPGNRLAEAERILALPAEEIDEEQWTEDESEEEHDDETGLDSGGQSSRNQHDG